MQGRFVSATKITVATLRVTGNSDVGASRQPCPVDSGGPITFELNEICPPTGVICPAPGTGCITNCSEDEPPCDATSESAGQNTIVGTPGNDLLVGGPSGETICGLGGNDRIKGNGGDDTLAGGPGEDVIRGGTGNDSMARGGGRRLHAWGRRQGRSSRRRGRRPARRRSR